MDYYASSSSLTSPLDTHDPSPSYRSAGGGHQHDAEDSSSYNSGGWCGAGSGTSSPARSTRMKCYDPRANNSFKVVIRTRPPLPRELNGEKPFVNIVSVDKDEHVITISENIKAVLDERQQQRRQDADDGSLLSSGGGSGGGASNSQGPYATHVFTFDHVYDQASTQKKVYETTARGVVDSALQGYNATIFAYGQTGTGKTYTMEGFNRQGNVEDRGIIPRAIEQIFGHIASHASPRLRFLVRASYLQIYNEQISDLLKPERSNLAIREDKKRGVFVEGLSEWVVRSPAEIYGLMERGGAVRATGSTKMNEISSRSHAVFVIIAEQSETTLCAEGGEGTSSAAEGGRQRGQEDEEDEEADMGEEDSMSPATAADDFAEDMMMMMQQGGGGGGGTVMMMQYQGSVREEGGRGGGATACGGVARQARTCFKVGKLNLVDLAGSERVRLSGATGQRLEESKKINQSLSALGNVIAALTDPKGRTHIPYRDSKLTRILEDSLGGNCKTTMMAMISPALEAMLESLSTLKFANRAKNIKNEAKVNEDLDQKSLLRKYERELKRLRAELEERSRNVVDKRRLLELDEQRRRAEADKMAAIRALEARSLEFMREKEEKRRLEERIQMLTSQMILRGDTAGGGGDGHHHHHHGAVPYYGGDHHHMNGGAGHHHHHHQDQHHERMRQEYEGKLADLERERESIEEEKAQVDRYKQLLLKQRDIMIALTQRLNERDEQIMALQDELDAYDSHQKELEEKLDEKTAQAIHLQRVILEANGDLKESDLMKALTEWGAKPTTTAPPTNTQQQQHAPPAVNTAAEAKGEEGGEGVVVDAGAVQLVVGATGEPSSSLVTAVTPEMLLTYKQYAPYGGQQKQQQPLPTLFVDPSSSSPPSPPVVVVVAAAAEREELPPTSVSSSSSSVVLLSAVDKIGELSRMVEQQKAEMDRMAKDLEDVRADKVSMEERLRGLKAELEKKVVATCDSSDDSSQEAAAEQQQDGAPPPPAAPQVVGGKDNDEGEEAEVVVALRRRVVELERLEERSHHQETQGAVKTGSSGGSESSAAALEKRCETLVKERQAVQTIMEDKIRVLLQNIASTSSVVLRDSPEVVAGGAAGQALRSNVTALTRLVNAFITALRNGRGAEAAPAGEGGAAPPPSASRGKQQGAGSSSNSSSSATSSGHSSSSNYGSPGGVLHVVDSRNTRNSSVSTSGASHRSSSAVASSRHKGGQVVAAVSLVLDDGRGDSRRISSSHSSEGGKSSSSINSTTTTTAPWTTTTGSGSGNRNSSNESGSSNSSTSRGGAGATG